MKIIHDIRIDYQSTPRLWMAYREGWEPESKSPHGLGKTPIEALAHLIEQELDEEEPNQCDGCRRGLKVVNGTHRDAKDDPVMGCTKHLYQ